MLNLLTALFFSGLFVFIFASVLSVPVILKSGRPARAFSMALTLLASILFLSFSTIVFVKGLEFQTTLYRPMPGLELSFVVDRLAAIFMMVISLVSACVSVYSWHYVEHAGSDARKNLLVSLMSIFVLSMLFVVASANSFSFLFFWEIMSLASFFMVLFDYDKAETQKSAVFYFVMTQMSTAFLMFGFLILRNVTGSFDIEAAPGISTPLSAAAFVSLFIGFGIKAGVMPFHKWLPYAHSASPSNISALMSGVMIKVAIYGLVRYILFVLDPELWWGILILLSGGFSALLGVIYALKEHDIKKLLAYHSIENIGIILMGVGLYVIFSEYGFPELALLSLIAGLFHTINHALFKSLLFLTAGAVVNATGTRDIEKMGGIIKVMPRTGVLFLIGAVSIAALPPFNGFVSELMIFQAFLQSFIISSPFLKILLLLGLSVFALTSALAAACFVKAFGVIFLAAPRSEPARNAREVSAPMLIGPAILAGLCMLLGIFSYQLLTWFGFKTPTPDMLVIGVILLVFLALVWLTLRLVTPRQSRISETWGCGIISQNSRMEYTASGFSEPILTIFRPIYRTHKTIVRNFFDKQASVFKNGLAEVHTFKIFEEKLYLPVARCVQRLSLAVSGAQNVDLDTYILYSFAAIIVLLLAMGWII